MREILLFETWSGQCPVAEFMASLTNAQQKKISWVLDIVKGEQRVPSRYLKKLVDTEGLWEVRVSYAGDAFRLLCFFDATDLVILVSGFAKKSEEIPAREIATAEQRRRDYLRRKKLT